MRHVEATSPEPNANPVHLSLESRLQRSDDTMPLRPRARRLTRDHPDPYGHTLRALARILSSQKHLFERFGVTELGIFIE